MTAATIFFLFAMVTGQGEAATLTTLGDYSDSASCTAAEESVSAVLKGANSPAQVFCVSSDDIKSLSDAAHQSK